ncbi:hypothetical protein C8Q76DRAFT_770579 [Earliella scabrosa]|nr:hypothetical protein C8Q76DRAFT_770579 [Earliella scabrosa]
MACSITDRISFELAELLYQKEQMPARNIDTILELWAASQLKHQDVAPFKDHTALYDTIDRTTLGEVAWESFKLSYGGAKPATAVPDWMNVSNTVHFRNPRDVVRNMLANPDFKDEIDYGPLIEFGPDGARRLQNFMGGEWAWQQADLISKLPNTRDSAFVPIILGSDKTTVSVATGQNDFYPLYLSIGNVHNNVRRAHRSAVAVIAFLAIPKTTKQYANSAAYRKFRRQLFHASLSKILQPLRPGMTKPEVIRCGDNHFRNVVYGIGPYIADYPEQALLTSIVQGWCPVCTAQNTNLDQPLDSPAPRRSRDTTDYMTAAFELGPLWEEYGVVGDIVPFTNDFPRADIHELISPDILHQLVKGTFKDHLVTWVEQTLKLEHGEARAAELLAEIDRRIAVVPPFSKLRHFHEGRGFKQWTGDDSKALMKIYLPAIDGIVACDIVVSVRSFLEFCYLARRDVHTEATINMMRDCLETFRRHREVFRTSGVRAEGFSLPRQHSLEHYMTRIWSFAAPNALCSSITESKHIKAVKEPWRRSNRYEALEQMLKTNQRLDKLAAARVDFVERGMLGGTCLLEMQNGFGELQDIRKHCEHWHDPLAQRLPDPDVPISAPPHRKRQRNRRVHPMAVGPDGMERPAVMSYMTMGLTPQRRHAKTPEALGTEFRIPDFREHIRRFLYHQLHIGVPAANVTLNMCPSFGDQPLSVFYSATATYYAPSDATGLNGMHQEIVRATPSWRNKGGRYDCIFVNRKGELPGILGLDVARLRLLFSFKYRGIVYPCAVVRWYWLTEDEPDEDTGMWVVKPAFFNIGRSNTRQPLLSVIHLNTIVRAAHLIGVYCGTRVPSTVSNADSLDHFSTFYVNKFADHHAFELLHTVPSDSQ